MINMVSTQIGLMLHTHYMWYVMWLEALGEMPLSFNYRLMFVCDLVTHVPPFTLCCHITPKDNQVTPLYTLWITPSVTISRNSSVHARINLPNSEAEKISLLGYLQNKQLIPVLYISNQNYLQTSYTNKNSYAK